MAALNIGVCNNLYRVTDVFMRAIYWSGYGVMRELIAWRYIELIDTSAHTAFQQKHSKLILAAVNDYWALDLQLQGQAGDDGTCVVFRLGGGYEQADMIALICPGKVRSTKFWQGQNQNCL